MSKDEIKIEDLLRRGVEEVTDKKRLQKALLSGNKLRIKHGIDPTGPQIHIGRAVSIWKLRDLQELGHQIVLVIGDFTAQIGDASDKESMRKPLSFKEIKKNMQGYGRQLGRIIDLKKTELRYNSEWLGRLGAQELLALASHFSAQQMIQRRNFKERWMKQKTIGLHEILYPLLQGFDSVAVRADLELGGSDQLFNLQVGRAIQRLYGQAPQNIITLRMVCGTDGRKMSASWGNTIGIEDSAKEQFGKLMTLRDELVGEYFELCSRMPFAEVKKWQKLLAGKKVNPRDAKMLLAQKMVSLYHGEKAAIQAAVEFERTFRGKKQPSGIPTLKIAKKTIPLIELLMKTEYVSSRSEAKRIIQQKGIRINGEIHDNWQEQVIAKKGMVVRVGKRKFAKIIK